MRVRCFYLTSDEVERASLVKIYTDLCCFSFCFALVVKEASSKQTNSSLRVFVLACVHSIPCTACTIDVQFLECVLIMP